MANLPPWNTIAALSTIRLALSLILFYGIVPYLIFPRNRGEARSTLMQRAIWMTFLTIAAVHFLTPAHMYSLFSLLAVYGLVALWTLSRQFDAASRRSLWYGTLALFGEVADRRISIGSVVGRWLNTLGERLRTAVRGVGWGWLGAALILVMLALSAWIRFVPVFHSAALPFSDSPLDLAWTKYPALGILYHNKIYPRGLYTFMSALSLLAGTNPIIVLRLMDPGLSVLVVAAAAYLVYRATDSLTAGAVAAVLLGVSRLLPYVNRGYFEGPISQQFGTAFALLFLAFAIAYLQSGRKNDLTTSAIAGGLTAFIHPVAAGLVVLMMVALVPFGLIALGGPAWRRVVHLAAGVGLVAGIAVLPVTIALVAGEHWHTASLSFLQTTTTGGSKATAPILPAVADLGALLAGIAVLSLIGVWIAGRSGRVNPYARQVVLAGIAASLAAPFLLPHIGLPSFVLATRSVQSLMIAAALGAGIGWSLIEVVLARRWFTTVPVTVAAIVALLLAIPPQMDNSAKMIPRYYTDQMIYQTLRAEAGLVPESWTLVTGPTGYALAVGDAYHQYPNSFLSMVSQLPKNPAKWVKAASHIGLSVSKSYVLMAEKFVPEASRLPPTQVRTRLQWGRELEAWVAQYGSTLHIHKVISNSQIEVWYFSVPVDP